MKPYMNTLLYCFLVLGLFHVCCASFDNLSEGSLRLEVKQVANSFETLVLKDRNRWNFKRDIASWKASERYETNIHVQEQHTLPLIHSRYKEVSLHGNVIPGRD